MEFAKKLLPLLLVAVAFAAIGYVIGHGAMKNQGASFYTSVKGAYVPEGVKVKPKGCYVTISRADGPYQVWLEPCPGFTSTNGSVNTGAQAAPAKEFMIK